MLIKEVSSAHQGCIYLIKNNSNIAKDYCNAVFNFNILQNIIYYCDQSRIFQDSLMNKI